MAFVKAAKVKNHIKMSLQGVSGSGKTFSALNIATHLCEPGKRIAVIDSENSSQVYEGEFDFDVDNDFGPPGAPNYAPRFWVSKIQDALKSADYEVLILDSCTHLWKGPGGFLTMVDDYARAVATKTGKKPDSFAAWKGVTPEYDKFWNLVRHAPIHMILTMRSKTAYEKIEGQNGKGSVKKVGYDAEFRDGFEFEIDAQCAIDESHYMAPLKHRLGSLLDGKVFHNPGKDFADILKQFCDRGIDAPPQATVPDESGVELAGIIDDRDFESEFRAAKSIAELNEVAKQLAGLTKNGAVSKDDYAKLAATYKDCLVTIRGSAA